MNMVALSVLAFVVALGILIAIHEFGHFWVARRVGIKVLRFSIGFGKPIWRRRGRDDTEFVLAALPLGGYVRMLDSREGDVPPEDAHRAFDRQPLPSRMAVVAAGPLFNFMFAIAAYWIMFVLGVPGAAPIVGEVSEGSPAAFAGLQTGDRIVAVGDKDTPTWQSVSLAVLDELLGDAQIPLTVLDTEDKRRALWLDARGKERALTERDALFSGLGIGIMTPSVPAVLGTPTPGSPGAAAGILDGDRVIALDGESVSSFGELVAGIQARPGQRVVLEVLREGRPVSLDLYIGSDESDGRIVGRIGVPVADTALQAYERFRAEQRFGPVAAVAQSFRQTGEMSALTVRMLWRMLTGDVSIKNISGPIDIARYAGQTASIGLVPFLSFLAIISISLGILNLLPIPVLDGGQLMFQFVELAKGSPVSPRTEMMGQQIGIALLLMLMSFAFYNDIARFFS